MDDEFLMELFAPLGTVELKRMFGGTGIFYRGLSFAGIMDGQLRLKADDEWVTTEAFLSRNPSVELAERRKILW